MFQLNEEETGTGCFLLNTPAVKFCWPFFPLLGNAFVYKEVFLFCHCLCLRYNELLLFVERFFTRVLMADPTPGLHEHRWQSPAH